MTLDDKYTLDIMNPYLTVVAYSYGGQTSYQIEYGRLDDRDFAGGWFLKISLTSVILSIVLMA